MSLPWQDSFSNSVSAKPQSVRDNVTYVTYMIPPLAIYMYLIEIWLIPKSPETPMKYTINPRYPRHQWHIFSFLNLTLTQIFPDCLGRVMLLGRKHIPFCCAPNDRTPAELKNGPRASPAGVKLWTDCQYVSMYGNDDSDCCGRWQTVKRMTFMCFAVRVKAVLAFGCCSGLFFNEDTDTLRPQ